METVVAPFVAEHFDLLFFALILLNVFQRRHQPVSNRKRFATLYLAVLVLGFHLSAIAIVRADLPDAAVILSFVLFAGAAWYFRSRVLPFRFTCPNCGERLSVDVILFRDDNLCPTCADDPQSAGSRQR